MDDAMTVRDAESDSHCVLCVMLKRKSVRSGCHWLWAGVRRTGHCNDLARGVLTSFDFGQYIGHCPTLTMQLRPQRAARHLQCPRPLAERRTDCAKLNDLSAAPIVVLLLLC